MKNRITILDGLTSNQASSCVNFLNAFILRGSSIPTVEHCSTNPGCYAVVIKTDRKTIDVLNSLEHYTKMCVESLVPFLDHRQVKELENSIKVFK